MFVSASNDFNDGVAGPVVGEEEAAQVCCSAGVRTGFVGEIGT